MLMTLVICKKKKKSVWKHYKAIWVTFIVFGGGINLGKWRQHYLYGQILKEVFSMIWVNRTFTLMLPVMIAVNKSLGSALFFLQHLLNHLDEPDHCCVSVCSTTLSWITALILFILGNSWIAQETSFPQWVVVIFIDSLGILTCALFVLLDKAECLSASFYGSYQDTCGKNKECPRIWEWQLVWLSPRCEAQM